MLWPKDKRFVCNKQYFKCISKFFWKKIILTTCKIWKETVLRNQDTFSGRDIIDFMCNAEVKLDQGRKCEIRKLYSSDQSQSFHLIGIE